MASIPLHFLVGITRLIAIYFGLKSVDTITSSIITYGVALNVSKSTSDFPNMWALYILVVLVYLALVVATWFLAPHICRLALKSSQLPSAGAPPTEPLPWSEILIFLTGILMVGWGIDRMADGLTSILQEERINPRHSLSLAVRLGFLASFLITGLGGFLVFRFSTIHAWCVKRKIKPLA